ncbi:MAG: ankyrin repeat domain-containing protein [Vulcanimicrobiota bacterium]
MIKKTIIVIIIAALSFLAYKLLLQQSIHGAVRQGDLAKTKAYVKKDKKAVNAADISMRTPLHIAAQTGNFSITEYLLKEEADVNSRDNAGRTPLHYAAENGHVSVVELLIRKGADVNARDSSQGQWSPYSLALREKHDDVAQLLRNYGAQQ